METFEHRNYGQIAISIFALEKNSLLSSSFSLDVHRGYKCEQLNGYFAFISESSATADENMWWNEDARKLDERYIRRTFTGNTRVCAVVQFLQLVPASLPKYFSFPPTKRFSFAWNESTVERMSEYIEETLLIDMFYRNGPWTLKLGEIARVVRSHQGRGPPAIRIQSARFDDIARPSKHPSAMLISIVIWRALIPWKRSAPPPSPPPWKRSSNGDIVTRPIVPPRQ